MIQLETLTELKFLDSSFRAYPLVEIRPTAPSSLSMRLKVVRGNRLSNATCLMQVFFKSGECFGKLW